jgi:hypothetical protein
MKSNKAIIIGLAATASMVLAGGSLYIAHKNKKYGMQIQEQINRDQQFRRVLDFIEVDAWATFMKQFMVMKLRDEFIDVDFKLKRLIKT